ncbi:MAG: amidohydrolase family protein [Flavobacteriaceae bacterium]
MKKKLLLFPLFFFILYASAQDYFPKNDGVSHSNQNFTAFTNATLYVTPTQKIEGGTLLIQNGVVVEAGKNVNIPANTTTINLEGKHIYPSFVDPYSDFGIEKPKRSGGGRSAQYEASRSGYYWNDHIRTEINAFEKFKFDDKQAKELVDAGFGAVSTHHQDGVARGTGMVVALNTKGNNNERILQQKATQHFSFSRSLEMGQAYPSSVMGSMALLRQMYYDAQWYEGGNSTTKDLALEALLAHKNLPAIFESKDKLNNLRADKVGDLFNIQYTIVGSGYEYENINEVKATNATYIIPLNFPDAYDVSNPYQASYVSLSDMRKWNQAPQNPKILADNSIPFAFTTHDLKSAKELMAKIQKAMEYGLSFEKALEALTTVPAQILKNNRLGNLNKNAFANFIITSGPLFEKETTLYENWIQGERHEINDMSQKDIRGEYNLIVAGSSYDLSIKGEPAKPKVEIKQDTIKHKSTLSYSKNWIELSMTKDDETYRMTGIVLNDSDNLSGRLVLPNGNESTFRANKTAPMGENDEKEDEKDKEEKSTPKVLPLTYPNMAYGNTSLPKPQDILFRNATVWTGEDAGILEATDVLIKNGKISKIGKNLSAGGARVVDATGKHLTAGIIDEHSHLALSSVNEGGHNSSAEVKMEDVVDPDDIGVYRALAGGVTSAQLLHGSANPIGGRSAIVKFKWGETADNMIYENSPKFIKFALGENVKQSNWGSNSRFPQTRMGVEQVYMDFFNRAKEYETKKKSGAAFRYDEEMETLVEILNGDRFISCHSYVQSEINMLMKVAEKFNFNVNTFTHILEGYKVAEIMEKHGVVGASTFSDWWGYKFEVNDAIPYNAAIMYNAGLNVSINSDDGEMIRRLNQEAAKAVKYGDVPEYEAWKMVTINPAKMLHLDDRVGSIKEGKDADVVLWNDNPLSMYAKPEKTLIEGAVYFDMEDDLLKRNAIKKERNDLIKMMLDEKNGGGKTQAPKKMPQRDFHCETDHLAEGFHDHH